MNDRLLTTSSVYNYDGESIRLTIPADVHAHLGEASTVCWFVDEDSGLLYVVPDTEVSLR